MTARVLRLVEYACKDTIAILKVLLTLAIKGELRGLIVCYRTANGSEQTVYTGAYKASPNKAAGASLRMGMDMLRAGGETE